MTPKKKQIWYFEFGDILKYITNLLTEEHATFYKDWVESTTNDSYQYTVVSLFLPSEDYLDKEFIYLLNEEKKKLSQVATILNDLCKSDTITLGFFEDDNT